VEKTYLAWVEGEPDWEQASCELAIADEPLPNGGRRLDPDGQPAKTQLLVRERQNGRTLVEAMPATGRTHQLRLHLAAMGYPIVGDPLYVVGGNIRDTIDDNLSQPMLLHSWKITFDHPRTGERVSFEAPPCAKPMATLCH
jgi:23S rRNA-/tRNA-specific pseudouridylate synthase